MLGESIWVSYIQNREKSSSLCINVINWIWIWL